MNVDKAAIKLAIAMGKAADAGFPQEMKGSSDISSDAAIMQRI